MIGAVVAGVRPALLGAWVVVVVDVVVVVVVVVVVPSGGGVSVAKEQAS
ncbi:MAG: hypothetical protein WCJ04_12850 [Actinomycetes bacterium]